jgi:regulator of protease activity HflC (stomatin/prohibitin superfamily)
MYIITTEIITENERGFLYKDGVYQRMLAPGKHRICPLFGESLVRIKADGRLDFPEMNLPILRKDTEFEKNMAIIDVPDDRLALHFVDGRIADVLKPGTHVFWNIYKKHTAEIIDITEPESAGKLPVLYMTAHMPSQYYTKLDVHEGETGLLFYNGVFQRTLAAGQYFFWNYNIKVSAQTVDMRVQQLDISGQEILTADKVSLRVNFVCSWQVTDPVSCVTKLKDCKTQLHVLVQLVLREFTGKYRFDELLRQKDSIGGFVLEKLKEREREFFVTFSDAGVKDIILPGEIRDIMNTVLVAEKSAQASVITRREETAATKSLLDTAKLMDENITLYKLKELEYLERICDKIGSISVDAGGGILKNLRDLVTSKP